MIVEGSIIPVPTGTKRPITTFSFKSSNLSTAPAIDADVRTLVVSWNEAAEIILSAPTAALVIPTKTGSAIAGRPPLLIIFSFSSLKRLREIKSPSINLVSPLATIFTCLNI